MRRWSGGQRRYLGEGTKSQNSATASAEHYSVDQVYGCAMDQAIVPERWWLRLQLCAGFCAHRAKTL